MTAQSAFAPTATAPPPSATSKTNLSTDPWDFDAPTWTDLNALSTTKTSSPPAVAWHGPQGRSIATSPHLVAAVAPMSSAVKPKAASPQVPRQTITTKIDPPHGADIDVAPLRQPSSSGAPMAPSSPPSVVASPKPGNQLAPTSTSLPPSASLPRSGSPSVKGTITSNPITRKLCIPVTRTASPPPAVKAEEAAPVVTTPFRGLNEGNNISARAFVSRPRKESTSGAPPLHHSFLAQTAPTVGRTAAVNSMASFLRPTLASWGRNQSDDTKLRDRNSRKHVIPPRPPSRGGPVRSLAGGTGVSSGNARQHAKESTEEREMRLAAEAKERLKQQIRTNRLAYERNRMVGGTAGSAPLRSTKALTIPQSPHLRLSARRGEKHTSTSTVSHHSKDPAVEIYAKPRPASRTVSHGAINASQKASRPLTVPMAPSFHTEMRALARRNSPTYQGSTNVPNGSYQAEAFPQSHLPPLQKQRVNASGGGALRQHAPRHMSPRTLTVPQTLKLSTQMRAAVRNNSMGEAVHVDLGKGRQGQERDPEENRHQFKARPLDRRILESTGEMGVPKVSKGGVTISQPFHFKTDSRHRLRGALSEAGRVQTETYEGKHQRNKSVPLQLSAAESKMASKARISAREEQVELEMKASSSPALASRKILSAACAQEVLETSELRLPSVHRQDEAQNAWQLEMECLETAEHMQFGGSLEESGPGSLVERALSKPLKVVHRHPHSENLSTSARVLDRKASEDIIQERSEEAPGDKARPRDARDDFRGARLTSKMQPDSTSKPAPKGNGLGTGSRVRKLTVPISPHFKTTERSFTRLQQHQA